MLLLLTGCAALDLLSPDRVPPEEVIWSGQLASDPLDGAELLPVEEGALTALDLQGQVMDSAEQPYEDSPDWWELVVPASEEVALRIEAPGAHTALWRGQSPDGLAYWYQGWIYTVQQEGLAALVQETEALAAAAPAELSDPERVQLWGMPLDPQRLQGAELEVIGADGQRAEVIRLVTGPEGGLRSSQGAAEHFFAFDLPAGAVTLRVLREGVVQAQTTWPARGGDLILAHWYVLP